MQVLFQKMMVYLEVLLKFQPFMKFWQILQARYSCHVTLATTWTEKTKSAWRRARPFCLLVIKSDGAGQSELGQITRADCGLVTLRGTWEVVPLRVTKYPLWVQFSMLLCRLVLGQLWPVSLGKEERNSADATTLGAFGQGSLSWQVRVAGSMKSRLFTGERCGAVAVPPPVWERAEVLTLHSRTLQVCKEPERSAVSRACEKGRGFGCFKTSEEEQK